MKKLLIITSLLFSVNTYCQEVTASGGNYFSSANNSISFTIGEPIIATYTRANNAITQGFHQTKLSEVNTSISNYYSDATIAVFPNPAINSVQVSIQNANVINYKTNVYDLAGKIVYESLVYNTKANEQIEVSNWAEGTYIIQIVDDKNQTLATAKIIKL